MVIKIELKKIRAPPAGSIDNDIDFICESFGYFTKRDKNNTAGHIFQFIVYHLNNFIAAGLVIRERNLYRLRSHCLKKSIDEIRTDAQRIFNEMMKIAQEIDEELGIFYR